MDKKKAKKKVVVIDDEIDFLELLSNRLKANDYEVIAVSSGKTAMDIIERENPDAVLLDIMMPGTDGLDILRRLRSEHKDLPVFMITAFSNEERRDIAGKLNASGFILKTNDLQNEINNITSTLEVAGQHKRSL